MGLGVAVVSVASWQFPAFAAQKKKGASKSAPFF
jgi:hypothetical protein